MNTNDIKVIREALDEMVLMADVHKWPQVRMRANSAAKSSAPAQQPRVRYRSQVSGMWYETLEAAGDVDCVEVDGVQFCQENGVKCLTQQQQPKRLTDEEIERLRDESEYMGEELAGFLSGLRYARDNGYLGGLSVKEVMEEVEAWFKENDVDNVWLWSGIRARLTAKLNGTLS